MQLIWRKNLMFWRSSISQSLLVVRLFCSLNLSPFSCSSWLWLWRFAYLPCGLNIKIYDFWFCPSSHTTLFLPFFHSSNSISMPGIAGQVSLSIKWFIRLCSSGWDMCISTSGERVPNILPTSLVKRACMNCSTHKAIPLTFSCEVATGTGVPVKVSDCCTLPG